jgi:TetR/AcrR family transcriptional regulator, tetracycline repressor protein
MKTRTAAAAGAPTLVEPHEAAPGRLPLSQRRIVEAAVAFVDAHCLADLSMRRLGGVLGVEAMSLYRYFPSKSELLDSVLCSVLAPLDVPDGDPTDWERSVRHYAMTFRQVAHDHPGLFPLLATTGPANSTMSRVTARMRAMWEAAGMDAERAARAQSAVQGFVTGTSLWEVTASEGGAARTSGTGDDATFEFGLDVLVAGLRARLGGAAAPRG